MLAPGSGSSLVVAALSGGGALAAATAQAQAGRRCVIKIQRAHSEGASVPPVYLRAGVWPTPNPHRQTESGAGRELGSMADGRAKQYSMLLLERSCQARAAAAMLGERASRSRGTIEAACPLACRRAESQRHGRGDPFETSYACCSPHRAGAVEIALYPLDRSTRCEGCARMH